LSRRLAALLVLLVPVAVTAGIGVAAGYALSNAIRVPRVSELATYRPDVVTELRGADGAVLARFALEKRILIERKDIPDVLVKALLAAEDARFYDHSGVDVIRIGGALLKDISRRRMAQGASTLTQQLARSVFLTPEKTIARKINEIFLTIEIEKRYSKDQILTLYLNEIYFGHGSYGVEAASQYFFGHPAKALTLPEAALLAGLIQRPEDYSPVRNPASARKRRDFVLRRMAEEGYIDPKSRTAAAEASLGVTRAARESTVGPYFCEEVRQLLEKEYGETTLYRGGLRVDTTLDTRLQAASEEALRRGLRRVDRRAGFRKPRNLLAERVDPLTYRDPSWDDSSPAGDIMTGVVLDVTRSGAEIRIGDRRMTLPASAMRWTRAESPAKLLSRGDVVQVETSKDDSGKPDTFLSQEPQVEGAVVILENATGAVRALVGGYDFGRSKFDRAIQALRQVGSGFKPFVYLTAVEAGFTPADTVLDAPITIVIDPAQEPWQPKNYYNKYSGIVTYQYALEHSINVPAVRIGLLVGSQKVVETARRLGIRQNLQAYPSLHLGSFEVTPMEMASAYAAIASNGLLFRPRMIERVKSFDGRLLSQSLPEGTEVASPQASYVLLGMLRGVCQRGTAAAASKLKLAIAGKTGTTNDFTDAWFIGMTPKHTIAVWIGHDTKKTLGPKSAGADIALPVWMRIVERMKEQGLVSESDDFETPPNVVFVPVDEATGFRATPSCARPVLEAFVNGTQPTELCGDAPHAVSSLPHYLQRAVYTPKRGEPPGNEYRLTDAPRLAPPLPKAGPEGGPPG